MALFDVLMPVKNGEAFLSQALTSVQAQTERDWRLLVLDHGSTDRTAEIVARAAAQDSRIELHPFPQAQGLAGLLNEGLGLIEAPYLTRMDADDECLPERMALTHAAFERDPDVVLVGGQSVMIDAQGQEIGAMTHPTDKDELARCALFRNVFAHPTISLRSQAVWDRGIRYGQSMFRSTDPQADIEVPNLAEDYLLFSELALQRQGINLPQKVLRYRFHSGSVSRQKYWDQLQMSGRISRHLGGLLARWSGQAAFDPVPFCSHGQALIDVKGRREYADDYARMVHALARSGPAWSGEAAERELRWRRTFVDRHPLGLASRALRFGLGGRADPWEMRTAMNALKQQIRGRARLQMEPVAG